MTEIDAFRQIGLPAVILVVVIILRRVTPRLLKKIIGGLRRAAEIAHLQGDIWDEKLAEELRAPVRSLVTIFGMWASLLLASVPDGVDKWVQDAFVAMGTFAIFWAGFRFVNFLFQVLGDRARDDDASTLANETILHFGARLAKALIVIIGFAIIVSNLGYDLPGLLAGLGLVGLAVALATQESLANLIGYFIIMTDVPFRVGDFVIAEKFEGTIETIGFRTTQIRRPDRAVVLVPNKIMTDEVITNWSLSINGPRRGRARLNMTLGVSYQTKPDQMLAVVDAIRESMVQHKRVVADSVIVHFVAFNESSLDIMVICVIKIRSWADLQAAKEDINIQIMRILEAQGVTIAYPTRTVFLEQGDLPEAVPESEA